MSAWCLRYIYTGVVSNETQEIGAAISRPANLLKDRAQHDSESKTRIDIEPQGSMPDVDVGFRPLSGFDVARCLDVYVT